MSQVETPIPRPADDPGRYLSHPDALYEVVDGQVVELPPMGSYAVRVATLLAGQLLRYLSDNPVGILFIEGIFVLNRARDLRRRPDVAFISVERWPADRPLPEDGDIEVVPDIAIEVLSPNDLVTAVMRKVREYFSLGVREVWLVDPIMRQISVYASPTQVRILDENAELDGGPLLPGFRLPVASVFRRTLR
jgi:Uma2 family endonuclease